MNEEEKGKRKRNEEAHLLRRHIFRSILVTSNQSEKQIVCFSPFSGQSGTHAIFILFSLLFFRSFHSLSLLTIYLRSLSLSTIRSHSSRCKPRYSLVIFSVSLALSHSVDGWKEKEEGEKRGARRI